ncbi:MAG: ATP-dependent helicase, partial [Polyangiaceae bacterium]
MWVGTFHATCAKLLRRFGGSIGLPKDFVIYDTQDQRAVVSRVLKELDFDEKRYPPRTVLGRIHKEKQEGRGPDEMEAGDYVDDVVVKIFRKYEDHLHRAGAVDFEDLIGRTVKLVEDPDSEDAKTIRRRFQYVLVDEFQDTNRMQYRLVRALASEHHNLCVVGDDDQSIYRWRGADIRNILDFERDFPQARIFKLEQNYRSTKTILAAADTVIRNNRERKEKRLWTENASGELVTYFTGVTEREEADFIAREIGRLSAEGGADPADIVVFYRVNAQARVIEEALVRRRVPYYVVGGLRFYEHREVKDLLAYLRVLANPADAVSVERMVGAPTRGVGAKTLEAAAQIAAEEKVTAFEALGRLETNSRVALRSAKQAGDLY